MLRKLKTAIISFVKRPVLYYGIGAALILWLAWIYLLSHPVDATLPVIRSMPRSSSGAGELVARNQAKLSSTSTLRVQSLNVDTGAMVQRGDVLAVLDDSELKAQSDAAEAAWVAARHNVDAARFAFMRQQSTQQHAEADAARSHDLARQGARAISASDLEAADLAAHTAKLEAAALREQYLGSQKTLLQQKKTLDAALARVQQTRLLAPFSGLITARSCSVGDTLSLGGSCLVVTDLETLYVSARFDESMLTKLRPGDAAKVFLKSQEDTPVPGFVETINRNVDPDTREFTVDIGFRQLPKGWAIGERAKLTIESRADESALTIPERFLAYRAASAGVWVEQAGRARWVPVRTGATSNGYVEIIDGLERAAVVLAPGDLRQRQRVTPNFGSDV